MAREKLPLAFFHGHRLSEEAPAALVYDAIILCRFDVKYVPFPLLIKFNCFFNLLNYSFLSFETDI